MKKPRSRRASGTRSLLLAVFSAVLVLVAGGAPASAQIVEEDLPMGDSSSSLDPVLAEDIQHARTLLASDRTAALTGLDDVIARLEDTMNQGATSKIVNDARRELARSLGERAALRLLTGDRANGQADLELLARVEPNHIPQLATLGMTDAEQVTFQQAWQAARQKMTAGVELRLQPAEARDSRVIAIKRPATNPDGSVAPTGLGTSEVVLTAGADAVAMGRLTPGSWTITVERPGFAGARQDLTLEAGQQRTFEVPLQRTSATIALHTAPPGAEVIVDGYAAGRTGGRAEPDFVPTGAAANRPASDFSERLWLDGLGVGAHELEIRLEGYRPHRVRVNVAELRDYAMAPVALEEELASLILVGLPPGARVKLDGRGALPITLDDGTSAVQVAPGTYRLEVAQPGLGMFESEVQIGDGQEVVVQVEMRPALVLVGILGGDGRASAALRRTLSEELTRRGNWTLIDRTDQGARVVAQAGLSAERLREDATAARRDESSIDWKEVQRLSDDLVPGSLYIVAALDDDLLAKDAFLWFWPSAPGPSQPDQRRLTIASPESYIELAEALNPTLASRSVSFGARFIDSGAAPAPVVVAIAPGSPAEVAGLQIGDELTAIGSQPIFTTRELEEKLRSLGDSEPIQLELRRPGSGGSLGATRRVEASLQPGLATIGVADPDMVNAAVAAEVLAALQKESAEAPRWLLSLDRALLHMRAREWDQAVEILRGIQAPRTRGLGQATVDYSLGIALANAGPRYWDRARDAFSRAAAATSERLLADDGPFIAPRARARLRALGGDGGR